MHPVLRTVLQRLGLGVLTLLAVSVIIFSSLEMLPGGYAENVLGQSATPETVAAFKHELGLDRPATIRYFEWIGSALQGDFGSSYSGLSGSMKRDVSSTIAPRLSILSFWRPWLPPSPVPLSLAGCNGSALPQFMV
jgi:peptide/nickel transport system permease protein